MLHPNATHQRIWMPTATIPPLGDGEVQVWRMRVDLEGQTRAATTAVDAAVTPEEHERAARFRQEADRQRFLCGKLLVRTFVGHHLGVAPRELKFVTGEHGKPEVAEGSLRFNLAHSGEWLLFGLARDRELGVDVERHRTMRDAINIAQRFFAPPEVEFLEAQNAAHQHDTFYRIWTRKEAIVKATGAGISAGLDRFAVSGDASTDVTLRGLDGDPCWDRWTLLGLDMPPNYDAAIAFDNGETALTSYEWTPW